MILTEAVGAIAAPGCRARRHDAAFRVRGRVNFLSVFINVVIVLDQLRFVGAHVRRRLGIRANINRDNEAEEQDSNRCALHSKLHV